MQQWQRVYLVLILVPCKSTSGTGLHSTNNLITSLRTQMDEDTMYSLSLLWRLQVRVRSLITSRLETLRQKCSVNICRLKKSRQKISMPETGVHHPKSYLVGSLIWQANEVGCKGTRRMSLNKVLQRVVFLCFDFFCLEIFCFQSLEIL